MRTINASDFKATCLALLDDVEAHGDEIVVTKRGRPVARLVPLEQPSTLEGSVVVTAPGDDLLDTGNAWDAE